MGMMDEQRATRKDWTKGRVVLWFVVGLLVLAGIFQVLETLVGPAPDAAVATGEPQPVEPTLPIRPEVRLVNGNIIEIDIGALWNTKITIRDDSKRIEAVLACIRNGLDESFPEAAEGSRGWWERREEKRRAKNLAMRIQRTCMSDVFDIPSLPDR